MADGGASGSALGSISVGDLREDGGRESTIARLYAAHWDELTRYIRNRFGAGPPEPEDVVQTAFAKVAALDSPQNLHNPRAFLYTTARNTAIDHHRRMERRRDYEEDQRRRLSEEHWSDFDSERVLLDKERLQAVLWALEALPPRQRRLVLRSRFQGMTCKEIAKHEGMTAAAVQKQISRALTFCLNSLDDRDDV